MPKKTCSKKENCVNPDGPELELSNFHKQKRNKNGLRYECKACIKVYNKKFHLANPDYAKESSKQFRLYNPNYDKENVKKYPEKRAAINAKRRASKLQRTVPHGNSKKIQQVYSDCVEINLAAKVAGCTEKFEVDHIIPLQGNNVSGLHVENNLQIILASENRSKNNKFTPGVY